MNDLKAKTFEAWAPSGSVWSPWAKAAPFAQLSEAAIASGVSGPEPPSVAGAEPARAIAEPTPSLEVAFPSPGSMPDFAENRALVIDLPGPVAVAFGLTLAARGYRPVPLFNSCSPSPDDRLGMLQMAVDTIPLSKALCVAADVLVAAALPPSAPPAFLLDSLRAAPGRVIDVGTFDNRSVVFASDFPSARFLQAQAITGILLIHDAPLPIGTDLLHALRPWHAAGGLSVNALQSDGQPLAIPWPRGGVFGEWLEYLAALLRLRRNPGGGYGSLVPEASGG